MQDEKSQIQNRAKALQVLRARLLKLEQDRQSAELSDARRGPGGRRRALREDPHLQLQGEPGHRPPHRARRSTSSTRCWPASSTRSSTRSVADERSRQLQRPGRRSDRCDPSSDGTVAWRSLLAEAEQRLAAAGLAQPVGRRPAARRGGVGLRRRPSWPLGLDAPATVRGVAALRSHARPAAGRRAVAVRAGPLGVPHARPDGRPPGAHPAPRDRGGGRSRPRRAGPAALAVDRRPVAAGRRPGHRLGRHRPVDRRRARRARGVGHRRLRRRPRRGDAPTWPGWPRGAAGPTGSRARGSRPCRPSCVAGSTS